MNAALSAALGGVAQASVAILYVLGLLVVLVFSVWGVMRVYALLTGESSADVAYKIGRVFGEEIYENDYERYRADRKVRERRDSFRRRYDAENG